MATIAEVAEDTFRINLEIPGAPIDVSFFVIRDEQPTLVETGFRRAFADTYQAVARVIDPTTLRHGRPARKATSPARSTCSWSGHRPPSRSPARSGSRPTCRISPSASPWRSTATPPWTSASTGSAS